MKLSSPHYLPLPLPYFSVLAFVLLVLIVVIERRALRYAHSHLGLGSRGALPGTDCLARRQAATSSTSWNWVP
jgi:hypothetical protein